MSRYIDADLIQYEPMCRPQGNGMYEDCEIAYHDEIDDIPTADVRENVKAEKSISGGMANCDGVTCWFECSACGGSVDISDNFCKHCGADMRGEEK